MQIRNEVTNESSLECGVRKHFVLVGLQASIVGFGNETIKGNNYCYKAIKQISIVENAIEKKKTLF